MSIAILIAGLVSLIIAACLGVFSPSRVHGPTRWSSDEPPSMLFGIACLGVLVWAMTWIAFVNLPGNQISGTTRPDALTRPAGVAAGIVADVLAVLALVGVTRVVFPAGLARLGLASDRLPKGLLKGIIGIVIVLPIVLCAESATELLWNHLHLQTPNAHELLQLFQAKSSPALRAMIIFSAAIVAPLAEEIFFRGFIQTFLRYSLKNPWLAILLTSVFFSLVHEWWEAPPIFVLALCLGYVYERTGNLWACIVIHALFNSVSITLFWAFQMGK